MSVVIRGFAFFTFFCGVAFGAPANRIREIDTRQVSALSQHAHPAVLPANDKGPVEPQMVIDHMMLMLRPSDAQQADLDRLLADQQNPSSPNFRHWLTPEEFGDRFGLSVEDNSKVVGWLESEGFTINEVARGRNWIAFTGTAAQVARSLHTSIHSIELKGKRHFANASSPEVPTALKDIVGGIQGLDDFYPTRAKPALKADYTSVTGSHTLTPEDWATIYNLNPLYKTGFDGTGQSIAVVEVGIVSLDDYRQFRTTFGLVANDPILVPYSSPTLSIDGEGTLDVEWAGAVAPRARMYYVYGPSAFTSMTYAINNNLAGIISNSYYTCEGNASPPFYRSAMQQANVQGITILSAAGDGGAAGCYDQFTPFADHGPLLPFPATLPEVTAVGGTMFNEGTGTYWSTTNSTNLGSALSYIPEKVWNESVAGSIIAGGTGGPSTVYAKPLWQSGPGVPNDNARDTPDVSLTSAGHDPYYVVQGGRLVGTYGTSAAAPSLAGIIAILEQYQLSKGFSRTSRLGNINPQLYRLAQTSPAAFHDIVDGDNKVPCTQGSPGCLDGSYGFSAAPGYDMATGLGSVDAFNFVTMFNNATKASTITMTSSASRITLNDNITFQVTVASSIKDGGTPTGTVDFSTSSTVPLGSSVLADDGTASITVPGYLLANSGTFLVYAQYSGDATFSGAGTQLLVTVTTPTGVSAMIPTVSNTVVFPSQDSQGYVWQETVRLREAAGVPSIILGFTIDGVDQPLAKYFPSAEIPAGTTVSSNVVFRNLANFPVTKTFGFTGLDVTGTFWSVQVQALMLAPPTNTASFTTTLAPLTMTQNPSADPSCQWSQQIFVDESAGYQSSISSLSQGAVSVSTLIPAIFGTTRLAGWNSLSGTLCWSGATPGSSSTVFVGLSSGLNQTLQVNFAGPAATPLQMTAAPATVSMTAADSKTTATASVAVTLSDKTQNWVASVFPSTRANSWLTVSPLSGTGNGTLKLQASGGGFEPGVYRATIVLQSPNAVSSVNIPVMFVLGSGTITGDTVISSVVNSANSAAGLSPGMIVVINGSNLAKATATVSATVSPRPLIFNGVSVQVNGVGSPILSISPSQLKVQIPYEVGAGPAVIGVNNNGQIAGLPVKVTPVAPAIFVDSAGLVAAGANALVGGKAAFTMTGDGDITPSLLTGFTLGGLSTVPSTYKSRFPVSVTIGGLDVFVSAYGLQPGALGTTLVNIVLPGWIPTGVQPLVVTVNGVDSPPAMINVATQ